MEVRFWDMMTVTDYVGVWVALSESIREEYRDYESFVEMVDAGWYFEE